MEYNLKPYWHSFLKKFRKYRRNKETCILNWDEFDWAFGGFSVTIPPEAVGMFLDIDFKEVYHRNNLTLKIFFAGHPATKKGLDAMMETSKIQNIYAQAGLASRVYDVVILKSDKKKYLSQVTDYIPGNFAWDKYDEAVHTAKIAEIGEFGKENGIIRGDLAHSNFKRGLFVDFQKFTFKPKGHSLFLEKVEAGLRFGNDKPYQSVEELGIVGCRDNKTRWDIFAKAFKEDVKFLPKNFTVLDFGCNGGYFLRRIFDQGAGYGVGVDTKEIVKLAEQIAIYLGYFKADFLTEMPGREFDLTFFLSMDAHFPFTKVVPKIKKLLYLEGHAGNGHDEKKYREMLEPHFKTIDFLGLVDDYPEGEPRLMFRAIR